MVTASLSQPSVAGAYSFPVPMEQSAGGVNPLQLSASGTDQNNVPDSGQVTKAVEQLNKQLTSTSTQVVFDMDSQAHRIWLNVVDKQSGKVVLEIPPENIRKIVDTMAVQGLNIDKIR